MPELNAAQLQRLRSALDAREAVLRREIVEADAERAEAGQENQTDVGDLVDVAEQRTRETVRDAEAERDARELDAIAAARARIEQGSYGRCIDCDEEIALARLTAEASVARCIACQERFEQRSRLQPKALSPS